jgi:hypothetical protein
MNHITTKHQACLLPYVAVLIGLYILSSAWVALLIYHLGIVLLIVYDGRISSWKRLLLGIKPWLLFSALAVCLLSGPLVFALWKFMALEATVDPGAILARYGLMDTSWVCFIIYFVVVNPVLEELFWRDYLRSPLCKLSLIDIAFAGYHILVLRLFIKWPWVFMGFCMLAITGCLWRRFAIKQHGLAVPWISHTVADASILIAVCALQA